MTTTATTAIPEQTSRVLALLVAGHTMQAVATRSGWPIGSVRKLITKQPGWQVDKNGRVYNPGRPGYKVQLPDGVPVELLEWARQLLQETDAPRSIQFQEPAQQPASPSNSVGPVAGADAIDGDPPAAPIRGAAAIDGPISTDLPLDRIHDHPGNIRDNVGDVTELADSIRVHGILQPLTVQPHPTRPGHYQLLAGHRRRAAALAAGIANVPCVVRTDVDRATAIELMLVENVQRSDLGPIEKAEAYGKLRDDHGYSATKIAKKTGLAQSTVSYFLSLLELSPADRARVKSGELAVGDAIAGIRRKRKHARQAGGEDRSWSWEPDYLTQTHPLAKKAARLCEAREHTTRRRIGQTACGQCWETVIRQDERVVIAAEAEA
ncbi:ParB/RepB/Spo0J family partition protein [Nonomuraea sp. 10N515B]|uniref:ParB/RepB/Spo0J family partition protein n=1 Tax=Nonomuraea sp. 10N515B TaxID=3457422 RepID=UPI003FCCB068